MNIFFTGCQHFGHERIIDLAGRPFSSVDEMNEALVDRWNARVADTDLVYILGDVTWRNDLQHWMGRLRGMKYIVLGNHDKRIIDCGQQGRLLGFAHYEELRRDGAAGRDVVLFHYPIEDWNGRYQGSLHLHAHTHSKQLLNPAIPRLPDGTLPGRYPSELVCNRFCVGVDSTGFAPITLEEIIKESEL